MADESSGSTPAARLSLEDFIETVTRSVLRAVNEQADVQGYALQSSGAGRPTTQGLGTLPSQPWPGGPIVVGLIFNPQGPIFEPKA